MNSFFAGSVPYFHPSFLLQIFLAFISGNFFTIVENFGLVPAVWPDGEAEVN